MKMRCRNCGSENVSVTTEGKLLIHHEIDLRHFPPHEFSDDELDAVEQEAIESAKAAIKMHKAALRQQRDAMRGN